MTDPSYGKVIVGGFVLLLLLTLCYGNGLHSAQRIYGLGQMSQGKRYIVDAVFYSVQERLWICVLAEDIGSRWLVNVTTVMASERPIPGEPVMVCTFEDGTYGFKNTDTDLLVSHEDWEDIYPTVQNRRLYKRAGKYEKS